MRVVYGLDDVDAELTGGVLAIGNFDGVHRGHQAMLRRAVERAAALGAPCTAMTFDPHPVAILNPAYAPARLTPTPEKLRQIEGLGVANVIIVQTDTAFLQRDASAFVQEFIVGCMHAVAVVEGRSFRYGRGRQGDVETLRQAGREHGFDVEVVDSVRITDEQGVSHRISSSGIREALFHGDIRFANEALGRPYVIEGSVVPGQGRGRDLGFATANVEPGEFLVPADGVYAARVVLDGQWRPVALSIGSAPTFGDNPRAVEAYVLDFDGDLYGAVLRIEVLRWIRGQEVFATVEALVDRMKEDVAAVRRLYAAQTEQKP